MPYYFLIAIGVAFVFAFIVGWFIEWSLIRHLYKRPLDTLLATWGVSLALQQSFRPSIGPKEVSPTLPDWLLGSWAPHEGLDIPINGMFVLGLTLFVTAAVMLALYRSRWGLRVRATVANRAMANATGINTKKTDRLTFAIGCGIAGIAGRLSRPSGRPVRRRVLSTSSTRSSSSRSAARPACLARWHLGLRHRSQTSPSPSSS